MRLILTFIQDALKIRPEEVGRTGLAFAYLFTSIGAFILARITTSTLFLEIPNYKEQLPLTYIAVAITVSLVMIGYARVERKLRRDQTNTITLIIAVVITLGFRILLGLDRETGLITVDHPEHEVYWAFLVWGEVIGTISIVQAWSLFAEVFNSRQAKRLFAVIGGGAVLANIAFGLMVRGFVKSFGTENLLYVIALCLAVSAVTVQAMSRIARHDLVAAKDRAPTSRRKSTAKAGRSQAVFSTWHVRLIAAVVVLTYLVSTLVDYQWKSIVGDFITAKDSRGAYFGDFYLYTGIIAAAIQFTATSRILERFGVLFALLLLPLCMILGTGTLVFGMLAYLTAATFTKGCENVLRYTVNDSTLQLLYLPVPTEIRGKAKATIDGILKPVSVGVAGFLMALLVGQLDKLIGLSLGFTINVYQLGWITAAALLTWVVALLFLRREYLKSLLQTLQRRRLNFADAGFQISDEGTIKTLHEALGSLNVGHVLHALELLPHVSKKAREPLHDKVIDLLVHEADEVRVAALNYMSRNNDQDRAELAELLDDADEGVRAYAILAYCAARREEAIVRIHEMLEDCAPRVQAASVAGLIRYGGLDGVLACADLLKQWLNSPKSEDRRYAAWVLGEVGVQNFYQPLIPLLADDSEPVRQEAITAAGKLRNKRLLEPLIEQLDRPRLSAVVVAALASFGGEIEGTLTQVLDDEERPVAARIQICRILGRLGDNYSVGALCRHIFNPDAHIRNGAVQALQTIAHRLPGIALDRLTIDRAIHAEATRWFENMALLVDLQLGTQAVLLRDALDHRLKMAQNQVLALLGLKYPRETIELVATNLQSKQAASRANAVEVLDNLLDKEEKTLVVQIFDDAPADRKLQAIGEAVAIKRRSRVTRLEELLTGNDPWLRTCAAMEVATSKIGSLESHIQALLDSDSPINRETALVVLNQLGKKEALAKALNRLADDPVPFVRRYVAFSLG